MSDIRWTVVVPVFNEREFLPRMLASLVGQATGFRLIIVDNGSTDGTIEHATGLTLDWNIDAVFLDEPRAGQVHALKRGIDAADTEFIAICDADTWYPPHYLAQAERLFDRHGPGCVAVVARDLPDGGGWRARLTAWRKLTSARLMPRQNHASGAGHCFRLEALRAAGGYDAALWPYVLKDHELIQRVLQHGSQRYHRNMWCLASTRRGNRSGVRWTLAERLLYHVTPFRLKTRLFHEYLAPRFAARGLKDTVLRQRPWESGPRGSRT